MKNPVRFLRDPLERVVALTAAFLGGLVLLVSPSCSVLGGGSGPVSTGEAFALLDSSLVVTVGQEAAPMGMFGFHHLTGYYVVLMAAEGSVGAYDAGSGAPATVGGTPLEKRYSETKVVLGRLNGPDGNERLEIGLKDFVPRSWQHGVTLAVQPPSRLAAMQAAEILRFAP